MSPGLKRSRTGLPLVVALAAALAAGCGSDEWNATGSSLPTDTSQDSVSIPLPPIFPVVAEVITPRDTIPAADRGAIYIGQRAGDPWRATPLLRFDVGDTTIQNRLPLDWVDLISVELSMVPMVQPNDATVVRQVQAFDLAAPLDEGALAQTDVTLLFGAELWAGSWNKGADVSIPLPKATVEAWLDAGTHNGVALYHASPDVHDSLYSTMSGYGGKEFPSRQGSRLWRNTFGGRPVLHFNFQTDPAINNFEIPVLLDMTHFERDLPGSGDLQIGSFFERRAWLQFDLGANLVPVDATINSGILVLQVRQDATMQVRPFSRVGTNAALIIDQRVYAWEAARSEAGDFPIVTQAWGRSNREVLDGSEPFNPDAGDRVEDPYAVTELRIDVTEYVQRQVNEIVPDDLPPGTGVNDVGLLLAFKQEKLDLGIGVFYGLDATDDLKPRLEITYTPPADSWR